MDEPLSKEQLQAIRERSRLVIAAREREAEAHKHMLHNPSAVRTFHALQDIRIEAEEDLKYHADEDIPTLLAHIDALEAELAKLRRPRRVVELPANLVVDEAIDPYDEDAD